jgi:hypothetical protein
MTNGPTLNKIIENLGAAEKVEEVSNSVASIKVQGVKPVIKS